VNTRNAVRQFRSENRAELLDHLVNAHARDTTATSTRRS
jgi:hypothetical protein